MPVRSNPLLVLDGRGAPDEVRGGAGDGLATRVGQVAFVGVEKVASGDTTR